LYLTGIWILGIVKYISANGVNELPKALLIELFRPCQYLIRNLGYTDSIYLRSTISSEILIDF